MTYEVKFNGRYHESEYCICDCCRGEGRVAVIDIPHTKYDRETDYKTLKTTYREIWMCDECRKGLTRLLNRLEDKRDDCLKGEIMCSIQGAEMGALFYADEHEKKTVEMMKHCIGMDYKKAYHRHGKAFYKPYRNHYDPGGNDVPYWEVLHEMGLAYKNRIYHLSDKGLEWLGERLRVKIYSEED